MAGGGRLGGQGQGKRAAIQSHHSEDRAADHSRGDRAVPRQRTCEGHRPDPRQETRGALWSRCSRRHRNPPVRPAIGRRDRPQAPGADRTGMARGEANPRDHAVPTQPRLPALARLIESFDHTLLEATSDGHCALPLGKLKLATVKLLEVPEAMVEQALSQMLAGGSLLLEEIEGETLVFLPHLRKAEEGIAARNKRLAEGQPLYPPIEFEKAVAWCEKRTGKTLAPSQREALKTVLAKRVVVITGGPGVGKTTLVNSILMILGAKGVKCLLCAPTGRAAKRLN